MDSWTVLGYCVSSFLPLTVNSFLFLTNEQFAYNLAAAHLDLRHTIAQSFMVSDVFAVDEGWKPIDDVPANDICRHVPKSSYPHVLHYCQHYYLGKWFIGKYTLRQDFISCKAPLLVMPPDDLATLGYTSAILFDGSRQNFGQPALVWREAFMICTMIQALNDAAIYYKNHHCDKGTANYNYTYKFFDNMTMPD